MTREIEDLKRRVALIEIFLGGRESIEKVLEGMNCKRCGKPLLLTETQNLGMCLDCLSKDVVEDTTNRRVMDDK